MILSFSEFNALYESYNGSIDEESYSNGIDIMEALLTVMNKKGTLTETEVVTFLDNVLEETGWELNEEVYESYAEWLNDWAQFIDEGINEDESELLFALTKRGENLLNEAWGKNTINTISHAIGKTAGAAAKPVINAGKKLKDSKMLGKGAVSQLKGDWGSGASKKNLLKNFAKTKLTRSGKGPNIGTAIGIGAVGAAGLGYGAYRGIKALRARSQAKKAAAQK